MRARSLTACALLCACTLAARAASAQTEAPTEAPAPPSADASPAEPARVVLAPRAPYAPLVLDPVRVAPWRPEVTMADPPSPQRVHEWYGWQIFAADGASLALGLTGLALGVAANSVALFTVTTTFSGLGFLLGGPIVHWARGQRDRGLASLFGLRLGLIAGGYLVGLAFLPVLGLYALAITGPIFAGVGLITGAVVDATVFGSELRLAREGERVSSARRMPTVRPMLAPLLAPGIAGMAVGGLF